MGWAARLKLSKGNPKPSELMNRHPRVWSAGLRGSSILKFSDRTYVKDRHTGQLRRQDA